MVREGLFDGVDKSSIKDQTLNTCQHCIQGKATRLPYHSKTADEKNATDYGIGEKIHSDIAGPMRDKAYGRGELYFITFIDQKSNYSCVYLMKSKESKDEDHITMIETQMSIKVKVLKSDRSPEYITQETTINFLKEKGIHRNICARAELQSRKIKSHPRWEGQGCVGWIYVISRIMGCEAILTAYYLRNVSPCSANSGGKRQIIGVDSLERQEVSVIVLNFFSSLTSSPFLWIKITFPCFQEYRYFLSILLKRRRIKSKNLGIIFHILFDSVYSLPHLNSGGKRQIIGLDSLERQEVSVIGAIWQNNATRASSIPSIGIARNVTTIS